MIGSEHLSHMLSTDTTGGRVIGEELTSALKAAHDELGVSHVRAHAILGDDLGVYREVDGEPVHDFAGVDRVYDHLRSIGMYPVVELSFMPHDLASDPSKTVFEYAAIVSPPQGLGPLARPDPRPGRSTWPTATASRSWSSTGRSRCGTRPTSRCSGRARPRSTCGSTT